MNVKSNKTRLYLRKLIREICGAPDADINDALATAQLAHLGQTRRSGESYIEHPKEVAQIVYNYYQDPVLCAAALLHDALEDAVAQGNADSNEEMASLIAGSFGDPSLGDDVLRLVSALTHDKGIAYNDYLLDLASDPQALKVKLADVLHNLTHSPSEKQIAKYGGALRALQGVYGDPPAGISAGHWRALKSAAGMEPLREGALKEYVTEFIKESKGDLSDFEVVYVDPPKRGSEEEAEDLFNTIQQHSNRKVPDVLQETADTSFLDLFEVYMASKGYQIDRGYLKKGRKMLKPVYRKLKWHYSRLRPKQVAQDLGIPWSGDFLSSAQTPSYPSGHAAQAYVAALMLIHMYPQEEQALLQIAEMVSQSRIDRGVHFQTDCDYAKELAYVLTPQILEKLDGK